MFFNDNPGGSATVAAANGVVLPKIVSINALGDYDDYDHTESCPNQGFNDYEDDTCDEEYDEEYL